MATSDPVAVAFAKLAGIRKALESLLDTPRLMRGGSTLPTQNFAALDAQHLFEGAATQLTVLKGRLFDLFRDFPDIDPQPNTEMMAPHPRRFGRDQLERLGRNIDQIFEVRAHSELSAPPAAALPPRVFISHGRATDWREVQVYIEKDVGINTLELAQEPNLGRTVLEKLRQESERCTSAVIVMTGDDLDAAGNSRARENVVHEIGFFQGMCEMCFLKSLGGNPVPVRLRPRASLKHKAFVEVHGPVCH